MVETPDWSNPLTIFISIFLGLATVIMVAGRLAIGFVAGGFIGGMAVAGVTILAMFKIFTEK